MPSRLTPRYLKQGGNVKMGYRFGYTFSQETLLGSMIILNIIFPPFDFSWYWRICKGLGLSRSLYVFLYVYKIEIAASQQLAAISLGGFAERTRFELVDRIAPIVGLANRWFQPLTHLSLLWRVCCLSDCKVNTIFFPCKIFTEKIF